MVLDFRFSRFQDSHEPARAIDWIEDDLMGQTAIPCVLMRGGTSRGPYFLASDLPADRAVQSQVLLAAMGSPDDRQIDGIGGATPLTSKVAIISPSGHDWADVDYLFAQVSIDKPFVDYAPSCGNILSGVGPFAIETGLAPARDPETLVRVRNVNTGSLIESVVQTPGGKVTYDGDAAIDGVPGTAAPIRLNFMEVVGSKTGTLLPTGHLRDEIDGVEVTCIDVAMPMVIATAPAMGKTGYETKQALDADRDFLARLERIRRQAGARMGLGDVAGKVIPKFGIIAPPRHGGTITSRYFTPQVCHAAHAVTGAICVGSCALVAGSVADGIATVTGQPDETITIEHPRGVIQVAISCDPSRSPLHLERAGVVRTARRLFAGEVYVPTRVWSGSGT
jgi:2-methylaconitate cis-trans-isomerase PrpF